MTWAKVDEIRRRYTFGESKADLARCFNVRWPTIHYIVTFKTWKLELKA